MWNADPDVGGELLAVVGGDEGEFHGDLTVIPGDDGEVLGCAADDVAEPGDPAGNGYGENLCWRNRSEGEDRRC